jgi:hypothetical protein
MVAAFSRRFEAGAQTADFALSPAAVLIRATRDDGVPLNEDEDEVQIALTSSQGRRICVPWRPAEEREKRLAGVDLGEYWITARSASGLLSLGSVHVALTPEEPVAEADLVLGRHQGVVEVVDEQGLPLAQAQVEDRESLLDPIRPGAFSLATVPVGEWLTIRSAGYLATCRILQPGDLPSMRVALTRDRGRVGVPGPDCPLDGSDLGLEAKPADPMAPP